MRPACLLPLLLAGCAASSPQPFVRPASRPSIGEQLRQQDAALVGRRVRTLLDFEIAADRTFVAGASGPAAGHTGLQGVRCGPTATVKIASLLFGLKLPAAYTLVAGYVRPKGETLTILLLADGREISRTTRRLPSGTWALMAIDMTLPTCRASLPAARDVALVVTGDAGFDLDDVVLIDNRDTLAEGPGGWKVSRSGLSLVLNESGRPERMIMTAAAGESGWAIDEVSNLRVRLHRASDNQFWTLLPNGRSILNGVVDEPRSILAKSDPAEENIRIDDGTARLDRETEGDADNDGYNERRGAFQIVATGTRLRFTATTRGNEEYAFVEIRGLPADAMRVVAAGDLIETTARLPDGTLLIRLPVQPGVPLEVTIGPAGQ